MIKKLRQLLFQNNSGNALIEFGITIPILVIMLIGTIETGRYFIIIQKLDKIANSMADFTTQGTVVTRADLDAYSDAIPEIMKPFTFDGTVIFSSVAYFDLPTGACTGQKVDCITWQYTKLGNAGSKVGAPGGNATIPGGYNVGEGENLISAEISYNYTPLLAGSASIIPAFSPHILYKAAFFKPRQGTLVSLDN